MRPIALAAPFIVMTLALAACSEPKSEPASAPTPAKAPAVLAGVVLTEPLQALGTEPFWGIEITPSTLTYTSPDTEPLSTPNPGPDVQGTTAKYEARLGGQPLNITLIATECSDGMSDRTYPLTAIVKRGDTTLRGCAVSKATLAAMPPA